MSHPPPTDLLTLLDTAATTDTGFRFLTPSGTEQVDYRALRDSLPSLAGALLALAGRPVGSPVLIVMSNGAPLVRTFFAAQWAGLIPAIVAPLRPFGDVGDWASKLATVARHANDAPIIAPASALRALRATEAGKDMAAIAWEDLVAHAGASAARATVTPQTIAFLQFTSGSLSHPKGVMLSHGAVATNALDTMRRMQVSPGDRFAYWVPLVHDMAVMSMMTGIASQVDQWIMPTEFFALDPLGWLRLMASERITFSSGPPFAFEMLRRRRARTGETFDLSHLRGVVCGAEPIDASVLRRFAAEFVDGRDIFMPSYGLAEMCCSASVGEPLTPLATVHVLPPLTLGAPITVVAPDTPNAVEITGNGAALDAVRFRVCDDAGDDVADGVLGRIRATGASMMDGYWADADATEAAFETDADGLRWLVTGDLGFLRDGAIFVAGREKDVIIVRGRHFFPEELDALIATVPGVRHRGVLTFGEVDPGGRGEIVTAVIEDTGGLDDEGRAALTRAIKSLVADRLDLNLQRVVFTPKGTLPRTTSGKPRRGIARQRWGHAASDGGTT